jgi:hypothetical protein
MFCTHCGAQTVDSRPGSTASSAMVAAAPRTRPAGAQIVRTTSSRHGTWAIVWTVASFVLCLLLWFPAFSQAKKSRLRGEAIAGAASSVTQIGFVVWLVLQVVGVMLFFWLGGQDPSTTTRVQP